MRGSLEDYDDVVALLANDRQFLEIARNDTPQLAVAIAGFLDEVGGRKDRTRLDSIVLKEKAGKISGASTKARNILLRQWDALEAASAGIMTIASVIANPWLAPFGMLLLVRSLKSALQIPLGEIEARVLLSLWKNKDTSGVVPATKLNDSNEFSASQLETTLNSLEQLGCIARVEEGWRIIEILSLER